MEIQNQFSVPLPRDEAWKVLLDIPRIAPCMPGAKLTDADVEAGVYQGEVQVRLGPVVLAFKGKAEITDRSDTDYKATVHAEGRDTKGRGGATADVSFLLEPEGNETLVKITSVLNLSGSVAQYGRGSGMINDLATHLIGQFAKNLHKEINQSPRPVAAAPAVESEGPAASPTATTPASEKPAQAESSNPISGISLFFWLMWRQIKRVFGAA
ncbi:MAG: SRPBCC family protein [Alphaproteobacteria bacterium]|nr:SRPBCC family protein [Alphaproteobacteria bacterium]